MTQYTLKAEGIVSDLAQGAAGAVIVLGAAIQGSPDEPPLFARSTPLRSEHAATLLVVTEGLKILAGIVIPGDRVCIGTHFGLQLPLLTREAPRDQVAQDISAEFMQAMATFQRAGVRVALHESASSRDPRLVREATIALMGRQGRAQLRFA